MFFTPSYARFALIQLGIIDKLDQRTKNMHITGTNHSSTSITSDKYFNAIHVGKDTRAGIF
jgi:hypothetical protein